MRVNNVSQASMVLLPAFNTGVAPPKISRKKTVQPRELDARLLQHVVRRHLCQGVCHTTEVGIGARCITQVVCTARSLVSIRPNGLEVFSLPHQGYERPSTDLHTGVVIHEPGLQACALLPQHERAAMYGSQQQLVIANLRRGERLVSRHVRKEVRALAVSNDESMLATLHDDGVQIWSSAQLDKRRRLPLHKPARSVFFCNGGRGLLVVFEHKIICFDIASGARRWTTVFPGHVPTQIGLCGSKGWLLFTFATGERQLLNAAGKVMHTWPGTPGEKTLPLATHDLFISYGTAAGTHICDAKTGQQLGTMAAPWEAQQAAASQDGRWLVEYGAGKALRIRDFLAHQPYLGGDSID